MVRRIEIARPERPARRHDRRVQRPRVEAFEPRLLLSNDAFLQGIVTISGTSQPLAGATVEIQSLSDPSFPEQKTTTGPDGVYTFPGLPSGNYQLTEIPPSSFANDTAPTQAESPLTPLTPVSNSTVDVQLSDPSKLLVSYPTNNKEDLTITCNGETEEGLVGQSNITVSEPDIGYTTSLFPSFCVDFYRNIETGDSNLPFSMEPLSTGLANDPKVINPQYAGEIAYLDSLASTWSTDPNHYVPEAEAAGLVLAIWELEYEQTGTLDVLNGSCHVDGLNSSSPEVTYAQNFLTQAQGQNELAIYLNGLPTTNRPAGSQGLIAPGSLNFGNVLVEPTLTSAPNPTSVTLSSTPPLPLNDTADLEGGNAPTGTITFTLLAPPALGGEVVYTDVVTVNGNGKYHTTTPTGTNPGGYNLPTTGTVTGTYQWNATYSGDSSNKPVSDNDNPNEQVPVYPATPTIVTAPNPAGYNLPISSFPPQILNDTAMLTGGYNPSGTITFELVAPPALGGGVVYTDVVTVNGNGTYDTTDKTPGTNPGGYELPTTANGTYQWNTSYSGDSNNIAVSDKNKPNEQVAPMQPSSISGAVYVEVNNNGSWTPVAPIPSATVTLTGTSDMGPIAPIVTTTGLNTGLYDFPNLLPGTYTITEIQPPYYLQGTNTVGTVNGVTEGQLGPGVDVISHIVLAPGNQGINYNFGELSDVPPCPGTEGNLFKIGPIVSSASNPSMDYLEYQVNSLPVMSLPIPHDYVFALNCMMGDDTYIIDLSASAAKPPIPDYSVFIITGGNSNKISILHFAPDNSDVQATLSGLNGTDTLSFGSQAIPSDHYFVASASAQPGQIQLQLGLSPRTSPPPESEDNLPHFVLMGQPAIPLVTIPPITAPGGVILLGDSSVSAFSVSFSNGNPGQFATQFLCQPANSSQPAKALASFSFATPFVFAVGGATNPTQQLLVTDRGPASRNLVLQEGDDSTGLIRFDENIHHITFTKPPGTSPDTLAFQDSTPGHTIVMTTTPGSSQIISTDANGPTLTITGAVLASAPAIQASAGQTVTVQLPDPGTPSRQTIAVDGPITGTGNLNLELASNVVSQWQRLIHLPGSATAMVVFVRYADGATYTVNSTNMNIAFSGSPAAVWANVQPQLRRPARPHAGPKAAPRR